MWHWEIERQDDGGEGIFDIFILIRDDYFFLFIVEEMFVYWFLVTRCRCDK